MKQKFKYEKEMQNPLIEWLQKNRRINPGSEIIEEMPWFGRNIDLVTVTQANRITAYELKLNSFRRAVEQAAYNRISFDRSYVVTNAYPNDSSLDLAVEAGVGVIVVTAEEVLEISSSPLARAAGDLRRLLVTTIRKTRTDVRYPILALS